MATKTSVDWGAIAAPVIGAVGSALGIGEKRQDRRQVEQQKKLNALDMENAQKMRGMQMQTWNETNYEAQMKHAKNAGLSMSIFGKGGGSSGATVGGAATGTNSGTAADPAMAQSTSNNQAMTIAQLGLMGAQKQNIEADTKNKEAGTGVQAANAGNVQEDTKLKAWENEVRKGLGTEGEEKTRGYEQEAREINARKTAADWLTHNAAAYGNKPYDDETSPMAIAQRAGYEQVSQALKNSKTSGNILEAQKAIEEFKANLAKQGITPDSPWYVKILGDLLNKVGLSPIGGAKTIIKAVKNN